VTDPNDILDAAEPDLAAIAEQHEEATNGEVDRRAFLFMSLAGAAASTFVPAFARAQATADTTRRAVAAAAPQAQQPAQQPFYQLGNGEAPAEQFMPYPGGTGALMERMVKEHGVHAFDRTPYLPARWSGTVPSSDEEIAFLPAHRLSAMLRARKITSTRLTRLYLDRLKRLNPTLNCAVTIMEQSAMAEAAAADREIGAGKYRGPLHGLPYGVKDLFSTRGTPTTWGTADFKDRMIDEDAEVVVRLRNAGAVLIAKLSTGLFAQNDQWFGGRTNNPWNLTQGSSGSSAGPASATAGGCVAFGIGTETQGSIVSPAIRCGLSALRPTFGRVSRYGGMVLAWSQDRVGPLCRTIEDCAMVFSVIHGADEKDNSTVTTPFHFDPNVKLASLRIGVDANAPKELTDRLRDLGMKPITIAARPTVSGISDGLGGLNTEYASAFDEYVTRKAKEIGLDLTTLVAPAQRGAAFPGANGATGVAADPMAPANWNPRFVGGRLVRGYEYINQQRRRHVLVTKWAEFMKDLDLFVSGPPGYDIAPNAQTGHPCAVVPYKFDVPQQLGGGAAAPRPVAGAGGARGTAGAATPPGAGSSTPTQPAQPALDAQPICAVIVGNLYNDDKILSVAHQFQVHDATVGRHPALA
jgi:Asp-tRNA(Asn)/Glu-tRNA(Gln) amidotransferase A subunit family amidase